MGFHGELVGFRSSGPIRVFRHSTSLGFTALSAQRASPTVIGRFTRRCRSFTFGPSPDHCRNLPDSRPGPRNGASARSRRSPRSIGGSPASRVAARRTSSRTRASSKPLQEIHWVCVLWSSQTTVTSLPPRVAALARLPLPATGPPWPTVAEPSPRASPRAVW